VDDQGEKESKEEAKESSRYYIKQGVGGVFEADIKALIPYLIKTTAGKDREASETVQRNDQS